MLGKWWARAERAYWIFRTKVLQLGHWNLAAEAPCKGWLGAGGRWHRGFIILDNLSNWMLLQYLAQGDSRSSPTSSRDLWKNSGIAATELWEFLHCNPRIGLQRESHGVVGTTSVAVTVSTAICTSGKGCTEVSEGCVWMMQIFWGPQEFQQGFFKGFVF